MAQANASRTFSILSGRKAKTAVEKTARILFTACSVMAIAAVLTITAYMIYSGTPALFQVGLRDILFGTVWQPTGDNPSFGILYVVLSSIVGTFLAILVGVPIALLTSVFLSELGSRKIVAVVKPAVELLAGIPSVIYGLMGVIMINPLMFRLEKAVYADDPNHQFTGGANLLSAVIVLAVMILPTVINVSESALRAVPAQYRNSSYALGASKIQTIFKVTIPAAKSGIITGIVLGIGRALGEAMAIVLVCGNSVNLPAPFHSIRTLTTAIVSEMSYSQGLHRQVLFTIGLVLFVFIMLINIALTTILKKGEQ